jgi:hypothetical protein
MHAAAMSRLARPHATAVQPDRHHFGSGLAGLLSPVST